MSRNEELEDRLQLRAFAQWADDRPETALGYKTQPCFREVRPSQMAKMDSERKREPRLYITDEDARHIDWMLCQLHLLEPRSYDFICLYYLDRMNLRQVAERMNISYAEVRGEWSFALGYLSSLQTAYADVDEVGT